MPQQKNEGEGSRTAARKYNEGARKTAERGVNEKPEALSDDERRELERAEREGRERAKEIDPAVSRDYDKPRR
ncbi:MAG: hypothetical protein WBE98_07605 [Gammaproteobacteria bacterium]